MEGTEMQATAVDVRQSYLSPFFRPVATARTWHSRPPYSCPHRYQGGQLQPCL